MRSFAGHVLALILLSASPAAAEMPVVPCSTLHFSVVGGDFSTKCRASEGQNAQGSWRTENIWASSAKGVLFLVRETPTDSDTRMKPVAPREVAEEFYPKGIEDWGPEMRIGAYRAHSFTTPGMNGDRHRCVSFTQNSAATSGDRARLVGMYCTARSNTLAEAETAELLDRIQLQSPVE